MSKRYLFVCGCPRSGTSAMWRTLSASPSVVIGNEWFAGRAHNLTPDLFECDRFFAPEFAVDCGYDINEHPETKDYVPVAKGRFEQAAFVGDKIPYLYKHLDVIAQRFPGAHIVFMLRDPVEVAASYKKRHEDPDDGWECGSVAESIIDWNASLSALRRLPHSLRVFVVHHEQFFGDGSIAALCEGLGIACGSETIRTHEECKRALRELMGIRRLKLTPGEIGAVYALADMPTYRLALAQLAYNPSGEFSPSWWRAAA